MSCGEWLAMWCGWLSTAAAAKSLGSALLSLSAGVETSEKALKGDNPDKAARPRLCGASSLRALECHACVYLRPDRARPLCLPLLPPRLSMPLASNKC